MRIARVGAVALRADFTDLYGGIDKVPPHVLRPASHFLSVPRTGQYAALVTVTTDDGLTGYGEAWGLPTPQLSALCVERLIGPMVVGRDARDVEAIWRDVVGYLSRLGYDAGVHMEALSGVDMALWDLGARAAGRPVSDLLGDRVRDTVECYVSPVMLREVPEESAASARELVAEGYRALKVKAGRGVGVDVAHVGAVRDAVGPEVELLVDANGGYDRDQAIEFAHELAPLDIYWLEEPVPPARLEDMAAVRAAGHVRIATGENDFGGATFERVLASGAADVVMPNVSRAGGLTGARAVAQAAGAHGAEFSLHGVGTRLVQHASLQLMSIVPHARFFEVNCFPNPLRDALAAPAPTLNGGRLGVSAGPGLGCEVDPAAVARFEAA